MTTATISRWPTLADAKAAKREALRAASAGEVEAVRSQYPAFMRDSWPNQQREAEAYQAWVDAGSSGSAPATPVLSGLAAERGIALDTLVAKVLTKVAEFTSLVVAVGGKLQRLEDQVEAATTQREVAEITW